MKLIDVMHRSAAQMGKLYTGSCSIISTNPMVVNDSIIRMNAGDHVGGTFFLVDQSYTIQDTTLNGNFTLVKPMSTSPSEPFPSAGEIHNYSFTDLDRSALINAINTGLLAMGEHSTFQDLDVTVSANREILLPLEFNTPLKIEFFHETDNGFVFSTINSWDLSTKDGQNVITFQNRIEPGTTIKLRVWYNAPHPEAIKDYDLIDPDYHARRVVYEAAYWGYYRLIATEQNSSDRDLLLYQSIMQERNLLANKHPVPRLLHHITLPRN